MRIAQGRLEAERLVAGCQLVVYAHIIGTGPSGPAALRSNTNTASVFCRLSLVSVWFNFHCWNSALDGDFTSL